MAGAVNSMNATGSGFMRSGTVRRPCVIIALCFLFMLAGCDDKTTNTFPVTINGKAFTLETAIKQADQARGLGGRTSIADDGGMIFIFTRDEERTFWMKDCLCDMDIIYLDMSGYVVSYYNMKAQPPRGADETEKAYEQRITRDASYPSRGLARYVIELQAGMIQKLGIQRGEKIDLDLSRLKELGKLSDGG